VYDIVQTDNLEEELPFQSTDFPAPPEFDELPNENWSEDDFPFNHREPGNKLPKDKTKNFRTGVRLCQCGHVFSLEMARSGSNSVFIRAKCRPTMCQVPSFYSMFIKLDSSSTLIGGNCKCPAGESQSCVHIAALLITLSEVTPQACTSMRFAWSRLTTGKYVWLLLWISENHHQKDILL